jgi:hypothetical protein
MNDKLPKGKADNVAKDLSLNERELFTLLNRSERLKVTPEELDQFDDSSFGSTTERLNDKASTSNLLLKLDELQDTDECKEDEQHTIDIQGTLFSPAPACDSKYNFDVSRQRFYSLIPLVIQAFTDIRDGWSADYVILNPERNLEFLQQCWRLGAAATPEELNWTLMNARKDGKLTAAQSPKRYSIAKTELDRFSFAAEMALRELQDRAWVEERRENLTLDKLLCSPRMAAQFDELAKKLSPGKSLLEYRWAAMTLRKARRLAVHSVTLPLFDDIGLLEDVRPSRLPVDGGLYWVSFEDRSAFVGVAHSLRVQVDSFICCLGAAAVPDWLKDRPVGKPRLKYFSTPMASMNDREQLRSAIFRRCGSRLNFKDASMFSGFEVA